MADITIAHHNLAKMGGGEAVCLNVIEALQDEHDITLFLSATPDNLDEINEYFNTSVTDIDITPIKMWGRELAFYTQFLDRVGIGRGEYFTNILKQALFHRYCLSAIENPDLFISTWDEIGTDKTSIQYIHWPRRYRSLLSVEDIIVSKPIEHSILLFKKAARLFAKFDSDTVRKGTLIANSTRTADKIEEWYHVSPQVLHPPIETTGLTPELTWQEREDGFIFLSRIHPSKNIEWIIEILNEVRDSGHDIHLHIIGPRDNDRPEYFDRIQSLSKSHEFVTIEGPMQGEELHDMLKQHKYGINGATDEQFGMAIAEMVEAGMIPFVPNSGGQQKIVGFNKDVMFESTNHAAELITEVLDDQGLVNNIKNSFPNIEENFGRDAFRQEIRNVVQKSLVSS